MGRFNFSFGKKVKAERHEAVEVDKPQSELDRWEQMANDVNAEQEAAEKRKASIERQQRKMMACMLTGDDEALREHDVTLSEGVEEEFLRRLSTGEITDKDEEEFLSKISGPIHKEGGAQRILEKLEQDEWQKQLFAWTTGRMVTDKGVESVFGDMRGVDLRTPVGFEQPRNAVLEWLKPQVNEQQYAHYEKSMDDLENTLYGKRFEYHQAFESLREKVTGGGRIYRILQNRFRRYGSKKCIGILQSSKRNFCEMQRSMVMLGGRMVMIGH